MTTPEKCAECGHEHAGPELGGICIGCPCTNIPQPPEPTIDDGGFADCRQCRAVMVVDPENRGVTTLFYGFHCGAEQVFRPGAVRATEPNILAAMVAIQEHEERAVLADEPGGAE